jgi:NAD binding domain of 6-phosphogluconate dehydrogenase
MRVQPFKEHPGKPRLAEATPHRQLGGLKNEDMADIGFIGLGIMGTPMALNLKKGGHQLFLFSRSGVKDRALLEDGGTACGSPPFAYPQLVNRKLQLLTSDPAPRTASRISW